MCGTCCKPGYEGHHMLPTRLGPLSNNTVMVKIPPINFNANHFLCTFISVSIAWNIAWINQFEIHKQYPHDDVTNQKCNMAKRNTLSSVWKCLRVEKTVILEQ